MRFVAGVHDWAGQEPPTSDSIAGRPIIETGWAHVRSISVSGGVIVGQRPLAQDGIEIPSNVRLYWSTRGPAARAERRFVDGDPPPAFDHRELRSPLTAAMLAPSPTGRGTVQFSESLTDEEFARVGEWLRQYPDMGLRAYGSYRDTIRDLEFLRFFPTLNHFTVDIGRSVLSFDGLRHLRPDLEHLGVGWTKQKLDLAIIGRFRDLKSLYLEGQTKRLEVVSTLTGLEELTLRSITLPDLSLLLPLHHLLSLDLKLGGTRDLRLLPRVGDLRYLELWMIKGLSDISMISRLTALRYLFLQALKQIENIPDLSECRALRRIDLQTMKGIKDLSPLATAPMLSEIVLGDMRHLHPGDLRPLVGMPHLSHVSARLGSLRKNEAAKALLGLPDAPYRYDWRAAEEAPVRSASGA